jgi:tetratricopeptide (TPR) repeat protein
MSYVTPAAADVLDFDHLALARSYLDRALELDPNSALGLALRASDDARVRYAGVQAVIGDALVDAEAAFAALTERERFDLAAEVAERLYMSAEGGFADDPVRMHAALGAARVFAEGALTVSDRFRSDPHYGTVVYDANIVLGQLVLRDGDPRRAVEYLHTAADSPGSPERDYLLAGSTRLASYLLREGERESIVAFYERLAELNPAGRDRWLADANAVRNGQMTGSYQSIYGIEGD